MDLQHIRKQMEEVFGWAKTVASCRSACRGTAKVDWQFTLAMAAYDLIRLPKVDRLSGTPSRWPIEAERLRG